MSRLRLFSFRSFFTLFTGAKSTRWPGPSRFALPLLFLCLLIAIAQFAVNLPLGIQLLRIGNKVSCQEADEPAGFEHNVLPLPVTFSNLQSQDPQARKFFSMRRNRGKTITNRAGMLFATGLISLFIIANLQDSWLNIDERKLHHEYAWCWKNNDEMESLWAQRMTRLRLLLAVEVLGGLGGLCVAFYFVLATTAASANRLESQRQSTRLQTLRTDSAPTNSPGTALPSSHPSALPSTGPPTPSSSAPTLPSLDFDLTSPPTAAKPGEQRMTAAEKRERAHMEAHRLVYENPFADREDPFRNFERRKDSAR
ncbi:Nn.00g022630.m01.CDS01 [Neocucurbitaria sp. VM-36]